MRSGSWAYGREVQPVTSARTNPSLMSDCLRALTDRSDRDIVGTPCCLQRYVVDAVLGGQEGLAEGEKAACGASGEHVHDGDEFRRSLACTTTD